MATDVHRINCSLTITMALKSNTAICLRCWDYSETSQTVSLLTKDHGIIRGIAKGSKRDTGVFSGGFDPLTQGHIVFRLKRGVDLATLTEWQLEQVWWTVRKKLPANKAAIYMLDLVNRMINDHDPHTKIFEALHSALCRIDQGHDIDWPILRFQWALLVDSGYRPNLNKNGGLSEVVGFSATEGGVVADTGGIDRVRVRKETIDVLEILNAGGPMQPTEPKVLHRANRLLAHYFRHIIGKESAAMRYMWGSLDA